MNCDFHLFFGAVLPTRVSFCVDWHLKSCFSFCTAFKISYQISCFPFPVPNSWILLSQSTFLSFSMKFAIDCLPFSHNIFREVWLSVCLVVLTNSHWPQFMWICFDILACAHRHKADTRHGRRCMVWWVLFWKKWVCKKKYVSFSLF